ncbi:MAG: glycosyltransferase family 4 protein [Halodesulfovibrio sp.]
MNVLVVDEDFAYPLNTGKKLRTYNLLSRLQEKHLIHYVYHDAPEQGGMRELPGCPNVICHPVEKKLTEKRGVKFYGELLWNLLSPKPYLVTRHTSAPMVQKIADILHHNSIDLIHCEWTPYTENILGLLDKYPCVLSTHNVESQIWQRYFETEKNLLKKAYIYLQWIKMVNYERKVAARYGKVVCVSENDAEFFRAYTAPENVSVVPNGVDETYFAPAPSLGSACDNSSDDPAGSTSDSVSDNASGNASGNVPGLTSGSKSGSEAAPASLVFTGSMDWRPNQDAVSHFVDAVFPLITAQRPDVTFYVVGRHPPERLKAQWEQTPGVVVTGIVDDVRGYIHDATVYVVPLRIGGGSRLKILEALSMEKVVVSTRVGAEGLHFDDGVHLLLRDSPDEFATAVLQVLQSPEPYAGLAQQGRRWVLDNYTWDSISNILNTVWHDAAARP